MEPLKCFDPDEKPNKPELRVGEKCPTCHQKIERRANLNELRKVVTVYKMATGYDKEDKTWDKAFFPVYLPTAKKLIDFLGSWEMACDCIQETMESIKNWNPEATISLQKIFSNHAANWKKSWQEKHPAVG